MNKWRKNKLPKLQAIMLAAERHSKWGITVHSFSLALIIHLFFLFGLKIDTPPIGRYQAGSVLSWVAIPKFSTIPNISSKEYLCVEVMGPLSKYINFPEANFPEAEKTENVHRFRIEISKEKVFPIPVRSVIFKIAIPDGKKVFSIVQSSGNADFDSAAADFISSFPIKTIPSQKDNKNTTSIVTITREQEAAK
jgi:hypothetical protein